MKSFRFLIFMNTEAGGVEKGIRFRKRFRRVSAVHCPCILLSGKGQRLLQKKRSYAVFPHLIIHIHPQQLIQISAFLSFISPEHQGAAGQITFQRTEAVCPLRKDQILHLRWNVIIKGQNVFFR